MDGAITANELGSSLESCVTIERIHDEKFSPTPLAVAFRKHEHIRDPGRVLQNRPRLTFVEKKSCPRARCARGAVLGMGTQRVRMNEGVAVDEEQNFATRSTDRGIADLRQSKADVLVANVKDIERNTGGESLDDGRRFGARTVVGDHQFELWRSVSLGVAQGLERQLQLGWLFIGRQDDGEPGHRS